MGPITQELIGILENLSVMLESEGERHWSGWMREAKSRLSASNYSGIEYLLSAYGGMASFNDVVLGQSYNNGVLAWKPRYLELNEEFSALRGRAWELANAIKRSQ